MRTFSITNESIDATLPTPGLPRRIRYQQSLPVINTASLEQKAKPAGYEPPDLPIRSGPVGTYDYQVQNAFREIVQFLSDHLRRVWEVEKRSRRLPYTVLNIDNNHTGKSCCSNISNNKRTPSEKGLKVDRVEEVKEVLLRCESLCEAASFDILRDGDSRDKIETMKTEFTAMLMSISNIP